MSYPNKMSMYAFGAYRLPPWANCYLNKMMPYMHSTEEAVRPLIEAESRDHPSVPSEKYYYYGSPFYRHLLPNWESPFEQEDVEPRWLPQNEQIANTMPIVPGQGEFSFNSYMTTQPQPALLPTFGMNGAQPWSKGKRTENMRSNEKRTENMRSNENRTENMRSRKQKKTLSDTDTLPAQSEIYFSDVSLRSDDKKVRKSSRADRDKKLKENALHYAEYIITMSAIKHYGLAHTSGCIVHSCKQIDVYKAFAKVKKSEQQNERLTIDEAAMPQYANGCLLKDLAEYRKQQEKAHSITDKNNTLQKKQPSSNTSICHMSCDVS